MVSFFPGKSRSGGNLNLNQQVADEIKYRKGCEQMAGIVRHDRMRWASGPTNFRSYELPVNDEMLLVTW